MKMLLSVVALAGLSLSCDIHQHVHAMMAQDGAGWGEGVESNVHLMNPTISVPWPRS